MRDLNTFLMRGRWLPVFALLVAAVACGGGESEPAGGMESEGMETSEPEPAAAPMGEPRVFFVAPRDGEEISVDIPVAFEFGVENYEVGAVPETVEQVRPGVGHYHLGVDAECLAPGVVIPQADPWIHFGDGSNTIEMSLEPGEHIFSVQMADDEHRTIEGLCETITIMLEEGI